MKLVVDTDEMHKVSQSLVSMAEEYTSLYQSLMNKATTMGEAWKAPDNVAFVEQIQGFCEELQVMAKRIEQTGKTVEQQAKNYENTCETNVAGVKQLTN